MHPAARNFVTIN